MKVLSLHRILAAQKIRCEKKSGLRLQNLLLKNNVEFYGYSEAEDYVECTIPYSEHKKAALVLDPAVFHFLPPTGLLFRMLQRLRPGIFFGVVIAFFILLFSGMFVWDVRVECEESVDDDAIVEELRQNGFGIGTFLPSVNKDKIENKLMETSEDIGWVSINMQGSIAVVDMIPKKSYENPTKESSPANLVAATDALITGIAVKDGRSVVKNGQVVKKGDLLVSGAITGAHEVRFVHATGSVYGRSEETLTVSVPLKQTKKRRETDVLKEITINFFGYPINIYDNTGNLPPKYDTIYTKKQVSFFGLFSLPVSIGETHAVSYGDEEVILTESEAVRAASREMKALIADKLRNAELLSQSTDGWFTDGAYVLTVRITVLSDIAVTLPFTVDSTESEVSK